MMIDARDACKLAVGESGWRVSNLRDAGDAWIVDVCGPNGEVLDISGPPLVDKATGKVSTLFPPRDGWRLEVAVECEVPEEYK